MKCLFSLAGKLIGLYFRILFATVAIVVILTFCQELFGADKDKPFYKQFLLANLGMPDSISGSLWTYRSPKICLADDCTVTLPIGRMKAFEFSDFRPDVQLKLEALLEKK